MAIGQDLAVIIRKEVLSGEGYLIDPINGFEGKNPFGGYVYKTVAAAKKELLAVTLDTLAQQPSTPERDEVFAQLKVMVEANMAAAKTPEAVVAALNDPDTAVTPRTYLSTSGGLWRVIHQGQPLASDRATREEALLASAKFLVTPTALWDGDKGAFLGLEETQAEDPEVPKPDWEALTKTIRPWDIFDGGESMKVSTMVKGLKEEPPFSDTFDTTEYVAETGEQGAAQILKDNGFDPEEVQAAYPDEYDELRFAVEAAGCFNIESKARSEVEFELAGMYSGGDEEEIKAREDFTLQAIQHGFTREEAVEVIENASYGGMAGIGVLADGGDTLKLGLQEPAEGGCKLSGQPILYCTDRMNGSGHYLLGKGSQDMAVTTLAKAIDHGSYSLGAVFGTRDWSY